MPTDNVVYLSKLHKLLNESFNLEEIRTLCLQLNVDFESIPGAEKPSMIRELLLALGRNGRLSELIILAQKERPLADWPPVPDDFQMPVSLWDSNVFSIVPSNQLQKQSQVLDAAIKNEVKVGESTIVLVLIRDSNSKGLRFLLSGESDYFLHSDDVRSSRGFQIYYPVDEIGNLLPTDVEIVITAPDFFPPTQAKTIEIDPNNLSEDELDTSQFVDLTRL